MAINLTKGQTIELRKDANDLEQITVGLGWKVREKKVGLFTGIFGAKNKPNFDLDAVAVLLDEHGRLRDRGDSQLVGGNVVFFNSRRHPSGTVTHSGDNRTGGSGAKDDEQIVVRLNSVPPHFHRILSLVCIYRGIQHGQDFGLVESAYIRAADGKGKEMARYSLSSEAVYQRKCTMVFGEIYRHGDGWKFRAIGDAHPYDSFVHLLKNHLIQ